MEHAYKFSFSYLILGDTRRTTVDIWPSKYETVIFKGHTRQNPKDTDVKETARKFAIADAIKNMPKEERKLVWEAYFARISKEME